MSDHIKISGPKALTLASSIAPLESDHRCLVDAIIGFQERPPETELSLREGPRAAVSSLDSLRSKATTLKNKGSSGFKIKRDPEQDPKIIRPFAPRTKSNVDES